MREGRSRTIQQGLQKGQDEHNIIKIGNCCGDTDNSLTRPTSKRLTTGEELHQEVEGKILKKGKGPDVGNVRAG